MKKTFYLLFIILAVVGCQEDPLSPYEDARPNHSATTNNPGGGGGTGGGTSGGTFTATVAGSSWSSNMITATEMMGIINIVATNTSTSTQISLSFNEASSVGTYNFDSFTYTGNYADVSAQIPVIYTASGPALEIISIDAAAKKVKGVFTFDAQSSTDSSATIKVTNGAFDLTYSSVTF